MYTLFKLIVINIKTVSKININLEIYMSIVKSQNNEEIIINEIFKKLNIKKGNYFEIGVNNLNIYGTIECNSLNLIKQGWDGHLIDAFFKHSLVINKYITVENVHEIADIANYDVDFFSIDIDSYDWHIVYQILLKKILDVKVFCVETNNYNGSCYLDRVLKLDAPCIYNVEKPIKSDAFGATTYSYNLLMEKFGYKLIASSTNGINAFFVKSEFAKYFPLSGDIEKIYLDSNDIKNYWNTKGNPAFMTTAEVLLKD